MFPKSGMGSVAYWCRTISFWRTMQMFEPPLGKRKRFMLLSRQFFSDLFFTVALLILSLFIIPLPVMDHFILIWPIESSSTLAIFLMQAIILLFLFFNAIVIAVLGQLPRIIGLVIWILNPLRDMLFPNPLPRELDSLDLIALFRPRPAVWHSSLLRSVQVAGRLFKS